MLHFHLKACSKCHGDLALDEGDWLCLQCGTYYYTRLYRTPVPSPVLLPGTETRIGDRSGDRREKAVSLLTSAAHELSQLPDMAITAPGVGRQPGFEIQPGLASTCRSGETIDAGLGAIGLGAFGDGGQNRSRL